MTQRTSRGVASVLRRGRPERAVVALVLSMIGAPIALWAPLAAIGTGAEAHAIMITMVFSSLLPTASLVLALLALRDLASKPRLSGRSPAIVAFVTAVISDLWCATIIGIVILRDAGM